MKHLSIMVLIFCMITFKSKAQNFFFSPKTFFIEQDSNYFLRHAAFYDAKDNFRYNELYHCTLEKNIGKSQISLRPVINFSSGISQNAGLTLYGLNGISFIAHRKDKWFLDWMPTIFMGIPYTNASNFLHNRNVLYGYGAMDEKNILIRYFHLFKLTYIPNDIFSFSLLNQPLKVGVGHYSLFADNKTSPYWQMQAKAQIWHLKYLVNVAFLMDGAYDDKWSARKRKYNFTHVLSWNISKRINFNFFETVIASAYDSTGYRGFDMNYLNPVIFYRPLEFSMGSPDNVLLGLALNVRVFKETILYGQILLDEFVLSQVKQFSGWWGNKQALLAGIRTPSLFGVQNMEWFGELVLVRPFVYAHNNYSRVYGHLNQLLAYPNGSNTAELYSALSFTKSKISLKSAFSFRLLASDSLFDVSLGNNPYKSYDLRNRDEAHFFLQGIRHDVFRTSFNVYYYLFPDWNLYLTSGVDVSYIKSGSNNDVAGLLSLGIISSMHFEIMDKHWQGMFFDY